MLNQLHGEVRYWQNIMAIINRAEGGAGEETNENLLRWTYI